MTFEHSAHRADVEEYAADALIGKKPANKWEIAACERYRRDLERAEAGDFPYRLDWAKADKVCSFVELMPHVKGHWAARRGVAKRIQLEPWQKFNLANIFGWVHVDTGLRRFRVAYICVPRKNSKSTMAAGIALYMLVADGECGAEVYCGATSEKQAWEVFRPAMRMAERTPQYRQAYGVQVNARGINVARDDSRLEPVIGKPGDGASPSCAIVDEFHEHPDEDLYDTMLTGMGSRLQALMLVITTAGSNIAGPCYALERDVQKVLEGVLVNEELYGIVYTIDKEDDWTIEEALIKANPNYGVSVGPDFLKSEQRYAVQSSRKQNTFKTKHLNLWVTARDAWMNMQWWQRQADTSLRREDFREDACYLALDLSSKHDITADIELYVRTVCDEEHYYVFGRYYLPEDAANDEDNENRHAYQGWIHDGHLIATDGNIIDYRRIEDDVIATVGQSDVREIGYDPWGATQLAQNLQENDGYDIVAVEIPQNVKHLSEPMKWVYAMTKAGRLHHDGNKVLAWMMSNVTAREDANENIYPRKEAPENKIDGVVGLIMAMSRALAVDNSPAKPVGIEVF